MSTIRDVAAAAQVSITTVSKVLNGYGSVSEETRKRVLAASQAQNYSPNRSAVQLVRGRRDTLGFMNAAMGSETARDEFLLTIINGVYSKAEALGWNVMMFTPSSLVRRGQNYSQFCQANSLAGLVAFGVNAGDPDIPSIAHSGIPAVFLDSGVAGDRVSTVSIDNETASFDMTEKCIQHGHRDILFVAGSEGAYVSAARQQGYLRALAQAGISGAHIVSGDFLLEVAYDRVKEYIFNHPEVTAIFCASDLMAIGAINACADMNYRVPEDISVVGFDNLSYCDYIRPQLTTVEQDFFQIGAKAVQVVSHLSAGEAVDAHYFVPYRIVLRSSLIHANARALPAESASPRLPQ